VGGQRHASAAISPERDPVLLAKDAVLAPGSVWTGVVNLASTGFDPRNFHTVASRYVDKAIETLTPAHYCA